MPADDLRLCSTSLYSVLIGLRMTCLNDSEPVIGSHCFGSWWSDNSAQSEEYVIKDIGYTCVILRMQWTGTIGFEVSTVKNAD